LSPYRDATTIKGCQWKIGGITGPLRSWGSSADQIAPPSSGACVEAVPVGADRGGTERGGVDMKDMMTHKGYFGSVSYDDEDKIFYGKIEFIRALVSYD
jgi:hypothetical protein